MNVENPYSGVYWVYWYPESVPETSIEQLLDNIKKEDPLCRGIFVKVFEGHAWQGGKNRDMSIESPDDLLHWSRACLERNMQLHVWGVVKHADAKQVHQIVPLSELNASKVVHSVILDVEPYEHYYKDKTKQETRDLVYAIKKHSAEDSHYGLCFDYRRRDDAIHNDCWYELVKSLHPMAYHSAFGVSAKFFNQSFKNVFFSSRKPDIPVVPMLQSYPSQQTNTERHGEDLEYICNQFVGEGIRSFSLFRYGDYKGFQKNVQRHMARVSRGLAELKRADTVYNDSISFTQIDTFQSCQRKWQHKYIDNIEPLDADTFEEEPSARQFGQMIHMGIYEALHTLWKITHINVLKTPDIYIAFRTGKDAMEQWIQDRRENDVEGIDYPDGEVLSDAIQVLERVVTHLDLMDTYMVEEVEIDGEKVPLLEHRFVITDPDTGIPFTGIVDAVLRNKKDGSIKLFDWKVRGNFKNDEYESISPQLALYQYAINNLYGLDVNTTVTLNVKPRPPRVQKYRKDGELNKNYLKYEWLRESAVNRSSDTLQVFWDNYISHAVKAREIKMEWTGADLPMSLGWQCTHCDYRPLCSANLYGQDVQYILDTEYRRRA